MGPIFQCYYINSARNHDGTMVSRQYTPISKLDQVNYFEVIIKVKYSVLYWPCVCTCCIVAVPQWCYVTAYQSVECGQPC